jgi:hypothetical protein
MSTKFANNLNVTRTAFGAVSGLNSLASATYVALTALDLRTITTTSQMPIDLLVELTITPGTVSGNKQAVLFCQVSLNNSVFTTGPTSGTTTTDQPDLFYIGSLPLNTNSTQQVKVYSVLAAIGFIPPAIKIVVLNDSGAAFGGSGNDCEYVVIAGDGT